MSASLFPSVPNWWTLCFNQTLPSSTFIFIVNDGVPTKAVVSSLTVLRPFWHLVCPTVTSGHLHTRLDHREFYLLLRQWSNQSTAYLVGHYQCLTKGEVQILPENVPQRTEWRQSRVCFTLSQSLYHRNAYSWLQILAYWFIWNKG